MVEQAIIRVENKKPTLGMFTFKASHTDHLLVYAIASIFLQRNLIIVACVAEMTL